MDARRLDIIRNGSQADALRTMEQIEARLYGGPVERVETDTVPETEKEIAAMTPDERLAALRRL